LVLSLTERRDAGTAGLSPRIRKELLLQMKVKVTAAAVCAVALVAAPTALAKSFSGTVKGDGISAKYTIKNSGKKVCVEYGGSKTSNQPETVKFSVKGGGSFKDKRPQDSEYCKNDSGFSKALKKAKKVKAKGEGAYGEKFSGTLK
jgi:hypothetical protein